VHVTRGQVLRLGAPFLAASLIVGGYLLNDRRQVRALNRDATVLGVSVSKPVTVPAGNGNGNGKPPPTTPAADPKSFRISGDTTGLWPGITGATLVVTAENQNNFPIVINSLTAAVTSVSPSSCPLTVGSGNTARSTVRVSAFSGSLRVGANSSIRRSLPITMDAAAPDPCSGASFTLTYGGTATKENQ
jgi:hypothetical protein